MTSTEFAEAMNHIVVLGAAVGVTVSETINGEKTPDRTYRVLSIMADHYGYRLQLQFYGPLLVPFDTKFAVTQQH